MEQLNAFPLFNQDPSKIKVLTRKIGIKLTRMQLLSLIFIMRSYFTRPKFVTMGDRSMFFQLFEIYSKKVAPKELSTKKELKLKLNYSEATTLFWMLCNLNTEGMLYETALIDYITGEIDFQTV